MPEVYVGSFNTGTSGVGNTRTVSDVPFQPKALIFWWNGGTGTGDSTSGATLNRGFGLIAGADQRGIGTMSRDNMSGVANMTEASVSTTAACIVTLTTGGQIDGLMSLVSLDPDGFTLEVTDAFSANLRVHYMAIGGDDVEAYVGHDFVTGNGTNDFDGMPFQPDFMFFAGSMTIPDAGPDFIGGMHLSCGAARSASQQAVYATSAVPNLEDTTNTHCRYGDLCFARVSPTALGTRMAFTSFLSDGARFSVTNYQTSNNAANGICYLALSGGAYTVGEFLTRTDGNDIDIDLGSDPQGAMFFSAATVESASNTNDPGGARMSIGATDTALNQRVMASTHVNNADPTKTTRAVNHDAVYVNVGDSDAVVGVMQISLPTDEGYTANMTDTDPSACFGWFFGIGVSVDPSIEVAHGAYTLSGVDSALKRASRNDAELGEFALAGQAARLLVGHEVQPQHGAYVLAGQENFLSIPLRISSETGMFALAGQDMAPERTYISDADQGALTLTGQTAGLEVGRYMAGVHGSYGLTGVDAGLSAAVLPRPNSLLIGA